MRFCYNWLTDGKKKVQVSSRIIPTEMAAFPFFWEYEFPPFRKNSRSLGDFSFLEAE